MKHFVRDLDISHERRNLKHLHLICEKCTQTKLGSIYYLPVKILMKRSAKNSDVVKNREQLSGSERV